ACRRADQVRRSAAQAEELTAAEDANAGSAAPGVRGSLLDRPRPVASSPIALLPDAQLRPLLDAYEASVRSRRWHTLLILLCIAVAMLLSSVSAEVSLGKLVDNIHRFPSYI